MLLYSHLTAACTKFIQQGNRRYHTSPVLCNTTTPSRPMGRIACAHKFCLYYLRLPQYFWMGRTTPKNCPFPLGDLHLHWGSVTPPNTWFRGPTRVFIQNGMSINSAVFGQRNVVSHYFTMTYVFPQIAKSLGGSGPPSNKWYLGPTRPPKSLTQTASRSVHRFV